jgi:hypothetical protein
MWGVSMSKKQNILKTLVVLGGLYTVSHNNSAFAAGGKWGLNIAYHNPVNALIGLNLNYFAQNFAFEIGMGGLDGNASSKSSEEKAGTQTWGDADIKYLFGSKTFRPYLEAGFTYGLRLGTSGSGAGTGSPFAGGGLMIQGQKLFGYAVADYVFQSKDVNIGGGIGFLF